MSRTAEAECLGLISGLCRPIRLKDPKSEREQNFETHQSIVVRYCIVQYALSSSSDISIRCSNNFGGCGGVAAGFLCRFLGPGIHAKTSAVHWQMAREMWCMWVRPGPRSIQDPAPARTPDPRPTSQPRFREPSKKNIKLKTTRSTVLIPVK